MMLKKSTKSNEKVLTFKIYPFSESFGFISLLQYTYSLSWSCKIVLETRSITLYFKGHFSQLSHCK